MGTGGESAQAHKPGNALEVDGRDNSVCCVRAFAGDFLE